MKTRTWMTGAVLLAMIASGIYTATSYISLQEQKKELLAFQEKITSRKEAIREQEETIEQLKQNLEEAVQGKDQWKGAYDLWKEKAQELQELLD